jgi:hypothetical protein
MDRHEEIIFALPAASKRTQDEFFKSISAFVSAATATAAELQSRRNIQFFHIQVCSRIYG